jgi:peptide/nickel transport system permease protein
MGSYVVRRALLLIPTFLLLTILVFLIIRLMPGNVIELMVLQHSHEQAGQQQIDVEAIRRMIGLDKPVWVQYWNWLSGLLHGDMGKSLWTQKSVTADVLARLPITFELGIFAFIIAQIVAFPIGILSAIRQDSVGDYIARSVAIIAVAVPSFWLATMVMVFPSIWWGWSPPERYIPITENLGLNLQQFLIPAAIMGFGMAGLTVRMLRTTMLDVLRQDYVRTAWAKGLRERMILMRHVLKNAAIPVVTIISGQIGVLIGGAVIMEQIFNIPGMGRLFVDAVLTRDYPYIVGINALFASVGLLTILVTDLSYAWLDPRIRYK